MALASSDRVRSLVIDAVESTADFLAQPAVADAWNQPSALDDMTVGALAAHTVRAAGATIAYLDRTDPALEPSEEVLTPTTYFRAALEAPIHDQIKTVSAAESEIGPEATVARCREVAEQMRARFAIEPEDRLVGALGGRMLSLDDFCRTRLIEVLIHLDDLATSVDAPAPVTDPAGMAEVVDILLGIARDRHGDHVMMQALARGERLSQSVFPVV